MAKNNLFLGTAAGSVGDVTIYVREGKQVSRVRRREISNPRTQSQSAQRATFAPAAKFYSPLAVALEKSFEGKTKGQSYQAFLAAAIKKAKSEGMMNPKGSDFFPLPYLLSKGTIKPIAYEMRENTAALQVLHTENLDAAEADTSTVGGLSKIFMGLGYNQGDQVTVIAIKSDAPGDEIGNYWPVYGRFFIEPDSTVLANDFGGAGFVVINDEGLQLVSSDNYSVVAGAIIISRYENDVWRRSTQTLAVNSYIESWLQDANQHEDAIASYMNGSSTVVSDVYLNGGIGGNAANIALYATNTGAAVTPSHLSDYVTGGNHVLMASVKTGNSSKLVLIKIGDQYLLTNNTKGALPEGVTAGEYIDGTDANWKAWLQSKGVAASVF